VTVTGRPAHVRDMQAGVNAIEAAQVIAGAFKAYEAERNRAEHIHPAFHGANHPVNVNLGTIEGGEWNSSVATRCRIGMRVGVMMGYTAAETKRDIERLVAEAAPHERLRGAKVELAFKGFMADPCLFDMDSEIARLSRRCFAEATGRSLREFPATGLTDGRHYALYQDTPCAVFGPDAQEIHGIDESVGVESFHGVTRCLALAIAEWCGVEPA
jgi:acetylornithine deacetylase